MKRFRVRLTIEADAQLDEINRWWEANRREHPDLVAEEVVEAIGIAREFSGSWDYAPSAGAGSSKEAPPTSLAAFLIL